MQTQERPDQTVPARSSTKAWGLAAVVVVVGAAIAIPGWLLSGDEPEGPVSGPDAAFTWEDDPSEWVTAEEMKAMFQHLSKRYADVDLDETEVTVEGSSPFGEERAWSGATMRNPDWAWLYDPEDQNLWVARIGGLLDRPPDFAPDTVTDPRLPEGVVITRAWAWGPELQVLSSDEWFTIDLQAPEALPTHDPNNIYPRLEGPYYDMYFEFVSWMLQELGWAD